MDDEMKTVMENGKTRILTDGILHWVEAVILGSPILMCAGSLEKAEEMMAFYEESPIAESVQPTFF